VRRKFTVVPPSKGDGDPKQRQCSYVGCESNAMVGSKFCSWVCTEKAFAEMKKAKTTGGASVVGPSDKDKPYEGEASEESISKLINPFGTNTGAHEVFELFRVGGTKEIIATKLDKILQEKEIKCQSPLERVRRVITDTRRLGFELRKSKGGFFKLTGRTK
jgi:hypothetical protein